MKNIGIFDVSLSDGSAFILRVIADDAVNAKDVSVSLVDGSVMEVNVSSKKIRKKKLKK